MIATTASRRLVTVGLARPRAATPLLLTHLARLSSSSFPSSSRTSLPVRRPAPSSRRTYVSAPKPGDGPLMERRADRELPDVAKTGFRWSRTLPGFLLIVAGCSLAIFNYQKSSSPVISSTLYALRTSPRARAYLGDEIYFQQRIPWISGEMNQLQGRINVSFLVKGTRRTARMHFHSHRPTARGVFETLEWSLEDETGHKIDLLQDVTNDPFRGVQLLPDDYVEELGLEPHGDVGSAVAAVSHGGTEEPPKETRGFRQPSKR